jgi:hypothetical protein
VKWEPIPVSAPPAERLLEATIVTFTPWQKPDPDVVWKAIEIYLKWAYAPEQGGPPSAVCARLDTLRSTPPDAFYDSAVLEKSGDKPGDDPTHFSLRLGNRAYPHMKLVIDRAPDGRSFLLRADTHDAHCQPRPGSPEQAAFAELCRHNRLVAEHIEAAWEWGNLPTFKKFLRDDLARRRGNAGGK